MTSKQEKMVNTLKKDIIRYDFYDSHKKDFTLENSKYEFKTFEVKDNAGGRIRVQRCWPEER